jgi:hypothetical protein
MKMSARYQSRNVLFFGETGSETPQQAGELVPLIERAACAPLLLKQSIASGNELQWDLSGGADKLDDKQALPLVTWIVMIWLPWPEW